MQLNTRQETESLVDELGGEDKIDLLVGAMYFHILNDPRVAHFFADASIERILEHQKSFLRVALAGSGHYAGRDLATAHRRLVQERGLNTTHFDIVIGHLRTSLSESGVGDKLVSRIVERVSATKPTIFEETTQ